MILRGGDSLPLYEYSGFGAKAGFSKPALLGAARHYKYIGFGADMHPDPVNIAASAVQGQLSGLAGLACLLGWPAWHAWLAWLAWLGCLGWPAWPTWPAWPAWHAWPALPACLLLSTSLIRCLCLCDEEDHKERYFPSGLPFGRPPGKYLPWVHLAQT